jgi:hypothetical protein
MARKSSYNIPILFWRCPHRRFEHGAADLLRSDWDMFRCRACGKEFPSARGEDRTSADSEAGPAKVSGLQRLWPRSLEATLRHFVLPMNILRARRACLDHDALVGAPQCATTVLIGKLAILGHRHGLLGGTQSCRLSCGENFLRPFSRIWPREGLAGDVCRSLSYLLGAEKGKAK